MGKFSEYPAHTTPVNADKLLIYDSVAGQTKSITYEKLMLNPHCTLSDPNTKIVSNTAVEYAVTFADNDDLTGITHTAGDSKIYVPASGDYLIAVSALIDTTNNVTALFDLWLKVNGVNLAKSNTQVAINSQNLQQVLAVTFIVDLAANDYVEVFYHANNTNARMLAVAAQAGPPVIPACPSIILAMTKTGT